MSDFSKNGPRTNSKSPGRGKGSPWGIKLYYADLSAVQRHFGNGSVPLFFAGLQNLTNVSLDTRPLALTKIMKKNRKIVSVKTGKLKSVLTTRNGIRVIEIHHLGME
jgi:hypothetical protein